MITSPSHLSVSNSFLVTVIMHRLPTYFDTIAMYSHFIIFYDIFQNVFISIYIINQFLTECDIVLSIP